jgi:hypothetical protein
MSLPDRCRGTSIKRIDHRTPLAGFLMPLLVAALFSASARAATFTINNQADFDARKTATYAPGDQILFKRGGIFSGMFAPRGSGTPASPIRISATGTGADPIINAMGVNSAAILLRNIECWEIDSIEVTNTNGSTADQGILFGIRVLIDSTTRTVLRHYHISNCNIHDVNRTSPERDRGAIHIDALNTLGNAPFRLDGVRITGNTIEDCGGVGISNTSSFVNLTGGDTAQLWTNVYVAQNYVARTGRNGIIGRVSKDAIYEYNTLSETSRFSTGHSIYNFETSGFIAQHNEAFGNLGTGSVDRGGFDADYNSENTTFQYNYSHDNRWFMGIMCRHNKGVVIRYNISQNETDGIYWYGFDDESLLENVVVHNNVHYTRSSLSGVQFIAGNRRARNTAFYNNIFHFAGSGSYGNLAGSGAGVSFSHNVFFNIPAWPHGGGDANAITSDPRFVSPGTGGSGIDMSDPNRLSGYRLQTNSPCINSGRSVSGVTRDFWGNPAPSSAALDIGVHETQPVANIPPVITLTAPANGSTVTLPATVGIAATASDSDGSIAKVEFYGDGVKLGEDNVSPYTWTWAAASGSRNAHAIAQDNTGARTTSATHVITVQSSNIAPSITLTTPANGSVITLPATVSIAATASDTDGNIAKVEFYGDGVKLGEDSASPYTWTWAAASGSRNIYAIAQDSSGARTTSATHVITVQSANIAPSITLTTPANGSVITLPATVSIAATASDTDGSVVKVEFYGDGVKLGEDSASPYTWNWAAAAGSRNVYAIAEDNSGARTASSAAFFTVVQPGVNAPPFVTLTAPASGAFLPLPGRIDFLATASDADGFVLLVEFYVGATKVGTDTTQPFSYVAFAAAGSHQLTAVAVDDDGARTTSASIPVTVGEPLPSVNLVISDASGGEFGGDNTVAFTLSRSGSTAAALPIPLTASGSASTGADYRGFVSPFSIPAGSSSANLNLTVLADEYIEGAETIRLTLGSSVVFTPGASTTAEATLHDRPLHAWLQASVPAGSPNGPNLDADGDGDVNLMEYFKGTLPGSAASRLPIGMASVIGNTAKVRFPRAKNRPDVSGAIRWSRDLLTWHASGATVNGLTVAITQQAVSPPTDDPETLEATATISGPDAGASGILFFQLQVTP